MIHFLFFRIYGPFVFRAKKKTMRYCVERACVPEHVLKCFIQYDSRGGASVPARSLGS